MPQRALFRRGQRGHGPGRSEMVQQRVLAPRSDAGISSSGDRPIALARLARCAPIAKRCASSRSRCRKYSTGSRGSSENGVRPGRKNLSRPALRPTLGDRDDRQVLDPQFGEDLLRAVSWPWPPSISTRSPHSEFARRGLPSAPGEAAAEHLAHHRVVVAAAAGTVAIPIDRHRCARTLHYPHPALPRQRGGALRARATSIPVCSSSSLPRWRGRAGWGYPPLRRSSNTGLCRLRTPDREFAIGVLHQPVGPATIIAPTANAPGYGCCRRPRCG